AKGRHLVFTLRFFQSAAMETHELTANMMAQIPKIVPSCENSASWLVLAGAVLARIAASGKSAQAEACATKSKKRQSRDWRSRAQDTMLPDYYYEWGVIDCQARKEDWG
ncbi:MAG: hypothetical protein WA639_13805, partial [Candidatus Acidiferrum sp.]